MATYYDLPYTGAEVAADLAKIHDKTSLVEEAPTDGKEYVRKNGGWVDLGLGDLSSVIDLANGEIVTVSLTNNQGADISYSGAVVHVVYDSEDHTYSVSGSSVIIIVPCNKSCTVSVSGSVDGFRNPQESVTFTSGTNSERSVTLEYQSELVYISLSASNITTMNVTGLMVTVNNTVYLYDGKKITVNVPMGEEYTISMDGGVVYNVPIASTYTAESKTRIVNLEVSVNTGIYIQDIDGKYYTSDTWDTANNANANGVAVILATCQFVVLPNADVSAKWATSGTVNIFNTQVYENYVVLNYNGKILTKYLMNNSYCNTEECAAYVCTNTISKRGKTGYLGGGGEIYNLYKKKTDINTLLTLIGGNTIESAYYLTSNSYKESDTKYYAWSISSSGYEYKVNQTTKYKVRVLTEL